MTAAPPASPRSGLPATALCSAILAVVALMVVAPTLRCPRCFSELYDWRYFQSMEEAFRTTVAEFGQVPLWNPYACGGEVGIANPQSTALAPTFLFSLALGAALGLKVALFAYVLAALQGGYLVARSLGASHPAALVAGIAYGGSGWFAMHLATGHINFAGAALYPYLLLCYLHAVADRRRGAWRFVLPGGALIAWMAALGGTYTVPMAVVLLVTVSATDAVRARSLRPLLVMAAIGAVALLAGAARFFPLLEFVHDHPRHVPEKDGNNAFDVARMFLAWRQQLAPVSGHVYWWHEYCCHLPYLGLVLAAFAALHKAPPLRRLVVWLPTLLLAIWTVVSLLRGRPETALSRDVYHLLGVACLLLVTRRTPVARFVPLVVVALGIVTGTAWPHGPWWLIRQLPLYSDLRVPARYLILVALVLSLWSAQGLDALSAWLAARRGPRFAGSAAIALLAVVLIETLAFDYRAFADSRFDIDRRPAAPGARFYQIESEWRDMFYGILSHRGVLRCDEEAPLQQGELDPGDVDQVRLVDPAAGTAELVRWTPGELTVRSHLERDTAVLINQNWNEHWRASPGAAVENVAGRLAVRPPLGEQLVTLRYRPRSFVAGAWVSAVTLALALLLFLLGRRA